LWLWILLQFGCGLQKQINPWKIPQNCPLWRFYIFKNPTP
jgi:hypothetical protein